MHELGLKLVSMGGFVLILLLCWLISEDRKRVPWRVLVWGFGLQLGLALLILKTKAGYVVFHAAEAGFAALNGFSDKGASFLFGKLTTDPSLGAVFAFQVLPIIIFISALMGLLYYLRVIQFVVNLMARIMRWTMKISGIEALSASLLVFMGIESSSAFKEYMPKATRSEVFVYMTAFMSTIATSVMAAYVTFGASAGHLLSASIMSAPAAVMLAKLMVPETGTPFTAGPVKLGPPAERNVVEAVANGASTGISLAIQVGGLLIAFVAMIWMFDSLLGLAHLSLDKVLGWIFYPFALMMGIDPKEAFTVGQLLGVKTAFNEFLAYMKLQPHIVAQTLSPRSIVITTYALCGFANFGSMAILIGGLSVIAPAKKTEIASLGFKALVAGTLASFMTAIIAGWLI